MEQQSHVNLVDHYFREIEQFVYREARLLDERRFHEWLDLLTEDIRYWMPVRAVVKGRDVANEFSKENELAIFDDTKETLTQRVARLDTLMAWSEEPASRTCRVISNLEISISGENEYSVNSNYIIYRTRLEAIQETFIGHRKDKIRVEGDQLRISERKIYSAQTLLFADNLSIFL